MSENFPFHPLQYQVDEHLSKVLASALTSMGPSFQITDVSFDEIGFYIDGACRDDMGADWLEELRRQALVLWRSSWGRVESMLLCNLREFWHYQGQRLRSRHKDKGAELVEVILIGHSRELLPSHYLSQRPRLDDLYLSITPLKSLNIKGHRERGWRLHGRGLLSKQARSFMSKLAPYYEKGLSDLFESRAEKCFIEGKMLQELWRFESMWHEAIKDSGERVALALEEEAQNSLKNGWVWNSYSKIPLHGRKKFLWNEEIKRGLSWKGQLSDEEIAKRISSLLHPIAKVVNMLGLVVEHRFRIGPKFVSSPVALSVQKALEPLDGISWEIDDHLTDGLSWELWGYDLSGTWWKLSYADLRKERSFWQVYVRAVISFERMLAMIIHAKSANE